MANETPPNRRRLPDHLAEKIATVPEYKMGATKVDFRLRSGEVIPGVVVAWNTEIVRIGHDDTEPDFDPTDIAEVWASGTHTCPVCGFPGLDEAPWDGDSASDKICPSCRIQFGYHDAAGGDPAKRGAIYERRRREWLEAGRPWCSPGQPQPTGWPPEAAE